VSERDGVKLPRILASNVSPEEGGVRARRGIYCGDAREFRFERQ
jgi:hypothetical protein